MQAFVEMGMIDEWKCLVISPGTHPTLKVHVSLSRVKSPPIIMLLDVAPLTQENAVAMEVMWS